MTKLLSTITAGALALSLSGFAVAADQPSGQSSQQGAQTGGQSTQSGGQATGQSDAYKAAVKKCEQMGGADMQKCMDQAKKKHGQM